MNDITLTKSIMRRVYFAFFMRKVLHPAMMKVYALFAVLVGLSVYTSINDVVANVPSNPIDLYTFSTYAFLNTGTVVQALVLVGLTISAWLALDMVRSRGGTLRTA